jgi:hypothetical protein
VLTAAQGLNKATIKIHEGSPQFGALSDLRTFFKILGDNPVHCQQLIPGNPSFLGYTDACKYGSGGAWISGLQDIRPIVWHVKWPPDIVARVSSNDVTINDLEMADVLLEYLLLEQIVPMEHLQTAVWCDNTSAVAWTVKMSSSKSTIGQQLTRALACRMIINRSSHLAALSIAGIDNPMADLASRSFKKTGVHGNYELTDAAFLTKFNSDFPLTQETSWLMLRLHNTVSSLVFSVLRSETPPMGWWLRLPKCACDIGRIGPTSPNDLTWTRFSETLKTQVGLHSSRPLPVTSVKGERVEDIQSASVQFRTRYAPSGRHLNWTTSQTPPTK